ncbi:UNVERIFIED_CONTAM: alpha-tubulin suppressor-like RCC1 family protein [Acetivibrio alkalicellulosi]
MKQQIRKFLATSLFLAIVLTNLLSVSYFSLASNVSEEFIYGDLNGDGVVNSTDITLARRYLLEIISDFPSPNGLKAADVNGDGQINSTDYALLRRYILEIIDIFPAAKIEPPPSPDIIPEGFTHVAVGNAFMVALKDDGSVWTWGKNIVGDTNYNLTKVPELINIKSISVGNLHALALKEDGTVWAWGWNESGQLGQGHNEHSINPVKVDGLYNIKYIEAANYQSFAINEDGDVWAWGHNSSGKLGIGSIDSINIPTKLTGISDVKLVSSADRHSLALKNDGSVWIFGSFITGHTDHPTEVSGISNAISVSAGSSHSLVLKEDGTVWAWGYNNENQLGDGTSTSSSTPIQVTALNNISSISSFNNHSMALSKDGCIWVWGKNTTLDISHNTPYKLSTINNISSLSSSNTNAAALTTSGEIWTWGSNSSGQLGNVEYFNNSVAISISPTQSEFKKVVSYSPMLSSMRSVGLKEDGTLWTWTSNQSSRNEILSGVVDISSGNNFCLALKEDGTVWAWGDNNYGQLGSSVRNSTNSPTRVTTLTDISYIATGVFHSIALKKDGTVWTWGRNNSGQLGNGTTENSNTPIQVSLEGIASIKALGYQTYALDKEGSFWVWGSQSNTTPTKIITISSIQSYYTNSFIVLLKEDGTVWTWGRNDFGQLGNGTYESTTVPIQVENLDNVKSISATSERVLALKEDGTIWAWGRNDIGQLGIGTYSNSNIPVKAIGEGFVELYDSIALKEDGSMFMFSVNPNRLTNIPVKVRDVNDTELRYLIVNNEIVEDFTKDLDKYSLNICTNSVPFINAIPYNLNSTINITQPISIPGTATIEVTAQDGFSKKTYSIDVFPVENLNQIHEIDSIELNQFEFQIIIDLIENILDNAITLNKRFDDLQNIFRPSDFPTADHIIYLNDAKTVYVKYDSGSNTFSILGTDSFIIESDMYFMGSLYIKTQSIKMSNTIRHVDNTSPNSVFVIADGNITIGGSHQPFGSEFVLEDVCFISSGGSIRNDADNTIFSGLLIAPYGEIFLNGINSTYTGFIYGKEMYKHPSVDVNLTAGFIPIDD